MDNPFRVITTHNAYRKNRYKRQFYISHLIGSFITNKKLRIYEAVTGKFLEPKNTLFFEIEYEREPIQHPFFEKFGNMRK